MDVVLPGGRDVRGTLDEPDEPREPETIVVACPPHPQQGGTRSDRRLTAVSDALGERGIACVRFDYGAWDEGRAEQEDVKNAIRWAHGRFARVGLFGFSFGATMALCAAADSEVWAVCALAPDSGEAMAADADAVAALDEIGSPARVLAAERDSTADWEPVVERARENGIGVIELPADHFFVGQSETVAERVATFFDGQW
ncbi:alpha/beta hydrolase [Halococcus dombrowskii]|uniref:Alpha/beta hydrolase n=1 Tax=Halococcus dombrowskii TaxID=179637 RepID=A0AAV3SI07_HALDO|nr:CocE/NonD family hydrolase [Halococcus dombrowskii]UOO95275.1 alpha/beta hydrolase [Halococcus dombrowskii]